MNIKIFIPTLLFIVICNISLVEADITVVKDSTLLNGALLDSTSVLNITDTIKLSGSPYYIKSNLIVPRKGTIIIEPGVSFIFTGYYKISVYGEFISNGTEAAPISYSGSKVDSVENNWNAIYFETFGSKGAITHSIIQDSKYGVFCRSIDSVNISNNIFKNNSFCAIYCVDASILISNNVISNGQYGIECYEYASPLITNNNIRDITMTAIYCFMRSNPVIKENILCIFLCLSLFPGIELW